jgi:hypothetical protein
MEVTFSIWIGGALLDEGEIAARLGVLRPQLQDLDGLEGQLLLYNSMSTYNVTTIRDALVPLIGAFCFDAVIDLAAGKDVTIPITAYDGTVHMKVEDDVIVISGTDVKEDRCPAGPLLEALVDCGERFIALLKALHASEPVWQERLAGWDQVAARARAALA